MKKMSTLFMKNPENLGRVINKFNPENSWVFTDEGVKATRKFDGTSCCIIKGKLYKRYDVKLKTLNHTRHPKIATQVIDCYGDISFTTTSTECYDRAIYVKLENGKELSTFDLRELPKPIPKDAIPCCDPDPKSGHWPHWIPCDRDNPADKYHWEAFDEMFQNYVDCDNRDVSEMDGTYELCGPKIQGNPEKFEEHVLVRHGQHDLRLTFPENGDTFGLISFGGEAVSFTFDDFRSYLEDVNIEGIVFYHPDGRMCKLRKSDFGIKR